MDRTRSQVRKLRIAGVVKVVPTEQDQHWPLADAGGRQPGGYGPGQAVARQIEQVFADRRLGHEALQAAGGWWAALAAGWQWRPDGLPSGACSPGPAGLVHGLTSCLKAPVSAHASPMPSVKPLPEAFSLSRCGNMPLTLGSGPLRHRAGRLRALEPSACRATLSSTVSGSCALTSYHSPRRSG